MGATVGSSCHHKKVTDWGFVLFMLSLALMLLGCVMGVIVELFFKDSTVFGYSVMWATVPLVVTGGVIFLVFFTVGMLRG